MLYHPGQVGFGSCQFSKESEVLSDTIDSRSIFETDGVYRSSCESPGWDEK
jgi:hypothetical protein